MLAHPRPSPSPGAQRLAPRRRRGGSGPPVTGSAGDALSRNTQVITMSEEDPPIGSKGYFKKRYRYTQDMRLQFLNIRNDSRKRKEYADALAELIDMIYKNISPFVNYNHVSLTIPQSAIPTHFDGAHSDIAYVNADKSVVFVMIHVQPFEDLAKKWKEQPWQKE